MEPAGQRPRGPTPVEIGVPTWLTVASALVAGATAAWLAFDLTWGQP